MPSAKSIWGQFLGNIALITEKLSEYVLEKTLILQGFAVVNVGLCDGEIQYFPSVIYDQMQLKVGSKSKENRLDARQFLEPTCT
jgi:hypothetical protein